MRGGIVAGALFAFIVSFENLEMTLFLTAPGLTTLPISMLQYLQYHIDPLVAAVAVAQVVLVGARADAAGPPGAAVARGAYEPADARPAVEALRRARRPWTRSASTSREGELVVLLGPSGCGKTTTLRMVAGFVAASAGDVLLDGQSIRALPPYRREMGLVFQSYALFPHLTRGPQHRLRARDAADGPRRRSRRAVDEMLRLTRLRGARRTGCRASSPAASSSGSRWPARWRSIRACCCWTSRSPTWTRRCGPRWRARSGCCSARSG